MRNNKKLVGIICTVLGGILWGASSVCGQFLFQQKELTATWLVSLRMFSAGVILLLIAYVKSRKKNHIGIFSVFRDIPSALRLIALCIFGFGFSQFAYYIAIQYSNAGTATVLQYTGPIMIIVYIAIVNKKLPNKIEVLALISAFFGTITLATHGNLQQLAISKEALIYGLISAIGLMVYNLVPGKLTPKYGTLIIAGWGNFLTGFISIFYVKTWNVIGIWDMSSVLATGFIIIFGTVISLSIYLTGVEIVGATKASLFSSVEPLTATSLSVIFLGVPFTKYDLIGFLCIIGAVTLLAAMKDETINSTEVDEEEYKGLEKVFYNICMHFVKVRNKRKQKNVIKGIK